MMWVEFAITPQGKKRDGTVGLAWTRKAAKGLCAEWKNMARLLAERLESIPSSWPRVSIRLRVDYRDEGRRAAGRRGANVTMIPRRSVRVRRARTA